LLIPRGQEQPKPDTAPSNWTTVAKKATVIQNKIPSFGSLRSITGNKSGQSEDESPMGPLIKLAQMFQKQVSAEQNVHKIYDSYCAMSLAEIFGIEKGIHKWKQMLDMVIKRSQPLGKNILGILCIIDQELFFGAMKSEFFKYFEENIHFTTKFKSEINIPKNSSATTNAGGFNPFSSTKFDNILKTINKEALQNVNIDTVFNLFIGNFLKNSTSFFEQMLWNNIVNIDIGISKNSKIFAKIDDQKKRLHEVLVEKQEQMNDTTELKFEIYLHKTVEHEISELRRDSLGEQRTYHRKTRTLLDKTKTDIFSPFIPVPYADTSNYVLEMMIISSILGNTQDGFKFIDNKKAIKKAMNLREV
jgi:hypothetical protein